MAFKVCDSHDDLSMNNSSQILGECQEKIQKKMRKKGVSNRFLIFLTGPEGVI